jgi:aldose 1-epimerase
MNNPKHRFQVIEEKFGAYSSMKLADIQTGEYAAILPYLGGTINGMALNHNGELIEIMDGYLSDVDVTKNLNTSFKGSNLFPFPNRILGGKYEFGGIGYQLAVNFKNENNAIHGLIFDQAFEIIDYQSGDQFCSLNIKYVPNEKLSGYPFNYSLEVEYRFEKQSKFSCTSKVTNLSEYEIPVGTGWHPYFKAGSEKVDDLWLQFPARSVLEVDHRMIPTGKSEEYSNFNSSKKIAGTKLDHCFVLKTNSGIAEILIENRQKGFAYTIWQEFGDKKYNYLQIYTPPARKSIAIEPMTCIPNAFNNKTGLILLLPGESTEVAWGVQANRN